MSFTKFCVCSVLNKVDVPTVTNNTQILLKCSFASMALWLLQCSGSVPHCSLAKEPQVECKRNVMAHAQKPDSVFQRNGRVHLYRRVCQFSRVLAFLECGLGENDCSNTGRTVPSQTEACLAIHSIRLFPLHFSSRASPCATRFRFHSTYLLEAV